MNERLFGKEVRMWNRRGLEKKGCEKIAVWLEEAAARSPEAATIEELLEALPHDETLHAGECTDCKEAAREFLDSRALLAACGKAPEGNPFFAKKVLAAIASREAEMERTSRAWAIVPKLASRLAAVACLALLLAGTWVYKGPTQSKSGRTAAEPGSQLLEDNATVPSDQDEVLVSLLERHE